MTDFSSGKSTLTSKEYKEHKICKHHFKHFISTTLACNRLFVSADKQKEFPSSKNRKGESLKQLFKYFSLPTMSHPLPNKAFLASKCQNVDVRGLNTLSMFV